MLEELRARIKGDLLDDKFTLLAYASDASIYEIIPKAVILPKDRDDVVNTVKFAYENNIPVIARGGGSGLVGQAIGDGIIIDFSRYMNNIISLDLEENYVHVQPGIYKSILDNVLLKNGKFLPPDPSSSNFCTLGGMIATNASGSHTVKYGSIIDYVLELEVVLSNGDIINAKVSRFDENDITKYIYNLLKPKLELINIKFPKVSKNSCGYRIDRVINNEIVDLSKLFVGSEGTLGIITSIKLKILDLPKEKALLLLGFKDTLEACEYIKELLLLEPSALELIDQSIIDLARISNNKFNEIIPNGINALLFVEFDDNVNEKVNRLSSLKYCLAYSLDNNEIQNIWNIRKNSLAYSMKIRGDKKPIAFIEDPVVDPSNLAKFVKSITEVFNKYNLRYIAYGHAGNGNIHLRPLLLLPKENDIMAKVSKEMLSIIVNLNGSISAEHGDGLARSQFIKDIYGNEIYELFVSIKRFFDPKNILNPGKKIIDNNVLINNLRYKERRDYNSILNWGINESSIVSKIKGYNKELTYVEELELCHGCGACRELNYSTRMCPVYKGLNIEESSCRGRNNILRWLANLTDNIKEEYYNDRYKEIIYKYCIECKACLYECPSNVNVGKIIAEARARYVKRKGLPKGYKYFVEIDRYALLGCKLAPFSNILMNNNLFRLLLERFTNIDARKHFPKFSRKRFIDIYNDKKIYDKYVIFFYDTYINYNDPYLGLRIAKILAKNGYGLIIPKQLSSGLPALLDGAIDYGKSIVEYNINNLYEYAKNNIPIITFSPSASLALRMEYLNVIDNYKSRFIANNTYDIHEFLYMLYKENRLAEFTPIDDDIFVHFHCHTIVLGIDNYIKSLLKLIPSLRFKVLEKGCCGVGGSYSFIKDNYDLSMAIGKELFNAVKGKKVYTTGESCKLQIEEGSKHSIDLLINLIAKAYKIY